MVRILPLSLLLSLAWTTTACKVSLECPPSQECIQGACQTAGCTSSTECDNGYLCFLGTCAKGKYVNEGETCGGSNRCFADLWCDRTTATCKRYLGVGEKCNPPADRCETDTVCNLEGVCAYYGLIGPNGGKPCSATEQCNEKGFPAGGLVCRYGAFENLETSRPIWRGAGRICARAAKDHFGEDCGSDVDCAEGLLCHWGVCLNAAVTDQYAPDGFACRTEADCCSRKCETKVKRLNGQRGEVRVCGIYDGNTPLLPGCPSF